MTMLPLANGIMIDTRTGQAINPALSVDATEKKERPSRRTSEAGRDKNNRDIRTNIVDLPADPKAVTTSAVVWMYYMLGLSDHDIADATGLTLPQIEHVKGLKLFDQLTDRVTRNMAVLVEQDMQGRISRMSGKALDSIEDIIDDGEVDAAIKLRASQDMLDRAGFSPKQIIEHKHKVEGGLIIKYIEDEQDNTSSVPAVDIDYEEAEDA